MFGTQLRRTTFVQKRFRTVPFSCGSGAVEPYFMLEMGTCLFVAKREPTGQDAQLQCSEDVDRWVPHATQDW